MTGEDIVAAALQMPIDERARLAHILIRSLDEVTEEEHEGIWLTEVERRRREVAVGNVSLVPWEETLLKLEGLG